MAAFLPVSELAHIGRQLADTLGATRRLYAVRHEPVLVTDGAGVAAAAAIARPASALTGSSRTREKARAGSPRRRRRSLDSTRSSVRAFSLKTSTGFPMPCC